MKFTHMKQTECKAMNTIKSKLFNEPSREIMLLQYDFCADVV